MALEAASFIFSSYPPTSLNLHSFNTKSLSPSSINLGVSLSPIPILHSRRHSPKKSCFQLQSAAETLTVAVEEEEEEKKEFAEGEAKPKKTPKPDNRRKLFVLNLPWSFSVIDIKKLFGECGAVSDVEIIKQKDGKNRGFAFVTMASGEEAQAAIEKFDSYIPHLRPAEYKRSRLPRNRRTVNRPYGGVLSSIAVRERIIGAFLVEEKKIMKKVLKIQKATEKLSAKS